MNQSEHIDGAGLIARMERVPFTRWHMRPRIIVGSATFFDAFDALSLAFVLPVLVGLWGITPGQIGILIASGYLGQFIGALVFSSAAEKFGRVRSVSAAVFLMSVTGLACAAAGNFNTLLALRFVQGIGVGGEMPVAASYINELSKAQGRGRFFLLYEMIFPVGLMVTGQVGVVVVPAFGWQSMFLIGAIPGLVIAALILRLPESPRWLIAKGRLEEAEAIIRDIEASTDKRDEPVSAAPAAPVPAAGMVQRSRWSELLSPLYRVRTLIAWTLWACAYFVANGLNNWMPTLYNQVYGLDLAWSLRAASMTNVMQVVILLICAFVIDRVGRRMWLRWSFVTGALLLGALGLTGAGNVWSVIVLGTLAYGVIGSVNAVLYLYTPEIYPTRMRAIGTGSATCWLRLASAVGPLIVGFMVAREGIDMVFLMFAAFAAIGAVAATQMIETRNRRLEDIAP